MPGTLAHIRQVHGIYPLLHLARAAHVLTLHPGGQRSVPSCPVSSSAPTARPRRRPTRTPPDLSRQPRTDAPRSSPPHHPARPVQQPLSPVRRLIPDHSGDRPPVPVRQVAHHRRRIPDGMQPRLGPDQRRTNQRQQLRAFGGRASTLLWRQRPRRVVVSSHKYDHEATARIVPRHAVTYQLRTPMAACRTSGSIARA